MITLSNIKSELVNFNLEELDELSSLIRALKTSTAKAELFVGQDVYVVQRTKKTPGVIKKVNKTRCLVDMGGDGFPSLYNVPMSMIRPA